VNRSASVPHVGIPFGNSFFSSFSAFFSSRGPTLPLLTVQGKLLARLQGERRRQEISQQAYHQVRQELVQCDAVDDVQRVDDIAEALGHFTAGLIAHHRVKKHLVERDPSRELIRAFTSQGECQVQPISQTAWSFRSPPPRTA